MGTSLSLLGNTSRVETPYIKVSIGDYTFGVYQKTAATVSDKNGFYSAAGIKYPNYVKSLRITKVNGQVNEYELSITFPITPDDDPNFFEKVFSSVSSSRKIVFSYGDMSLPTYVYRNEEAIITDVTSSFSIKTSHINYVVYAVSSALLTQSGSYSFINTEKKKPSDEIKKLLYTKSYGLQEVFYGMSNRSLVEAANLIPGDDAAVELESKTNISPLDYLSYLVSCMVPASSDSNSIKQQNFYILSMLDDTSGEFGGPYFKISKVTKYLENSEAYEIDIGYPTANIVKSFNIENNENYSLFYDWNSDTDNYIYRINDKGEWDKIYSPIVSSNNNTYKTRTTDKTWWSKITQYPISANITLKGLLRPAILMSYIRLNVLFYGTKHISSGLYIVTKQIDNVSESGYETTLYITKVSGD